MSKLFVKLRDRIRDTAGAAIALVALAMVALLSAVALAVDVGMMVTARTEAQVVADGAALAGARMLRDTQGNIDDARAEAMAAGSNDNLVRGKLVTILEEDVDVIPEEWTVRVRVHRTRARDAGLGTFFAGIFGVHQVDVTASAAAWAVDATTLGSHDSSCPALPLALLSKYLENGEELGWQSPEEIVGWSEDDWGDVVRLKTQPSQSGDEEGAPVVNTIDYCNDTGGSSWRCWWRFEEEDPNTENAAEKIRGENCTQPVSTEDDLYNASGNMQALLDDFRWLIEQEPWLEWCNDCVVDEATGEFTPCVVDINDPTTCSVGYSLRKRSVPIVDPESVNGSGSETNGNVIGYIGVFVEKVQAEFHAEEPGPAGQQNVYLRLMYAAGEDPGTNPPDEDTESLVKALQLIE